jgi:hypothetical protein
MIKFLGVSALLLVISSAPVAAQESNACVDIGKNNGSLFDVPFVSTGTPLLSRFGFALNQGDNHIKQILVWPGLPPGMMRVDFSDDSPFGGLLGLLHNDDYCFNVTHFDVVDARIRQVTRGLDICDAPQCTVQLDRPNGDFVFVLIGFQFQFREHDNHIKEVSIKETGGKLTVGFHDQHFDPPDDTFNWSVQYAYVPRDRFSQVGQLSGTRAHDRVIASLPQGKAVLRGFSFTFKTYFTSGDDHHLQQIGVRPNTTGSAFLTYRDENGDDGFDWEYQWAMIKTIGVFPGEISALPVESSSERH